MNRWIALIALTGALWSVGAHAGRRTAEPVDAPKSEAAETAPTAVSLAPAVETLRDLQASAERAGGALAAGLEEQLRLLTGDVPTEGTRGDRGARDPFHLPYPESVSYGPPPELSWYPLGEVVVAGWLEERGDSPRVELGALPAVPDPDGLYRLAGPPLAEGYWTLYLETASGRRLFVRFEVASPDARSLASCQVPKKRRPLCEALVAAAVGDFWTAEAALDPTRADHEALRFALRAAYGRLPPEPSP